MTSELLDEELEVLEAIYPDELTKISDREIEVAVCSDSPDESQQLSLLLHITYPGHYPETLPDLVIVPEEGELTEQESADLLSSLTNIGRENLGAALTFTLLSHLKEQLTLLLEERLHTHQLQEDEQERVALEAEESRSRGTLVTPESFKSWRIEFLAEQETIKQTAQNNQLKVLNGKEREEQRKISLRLTGRQLFDKNTNLDTSDITDLEEGVISVDISQYARQLDETEDREDHINFSDSD